MITKYPYLGSSPNLMEYFSIIGYDDITLSNAKENKNIKIKPTILSSICSRQDYGIVDNDLIIRQIYPINPVFHTKLFQGQKKNKPKPESVIYSFCFDSVNGKSKLFYVCFGFRFYEEYSYLYAPKAFCIVSQYPYFTLFENICNDLYKFYNDNRKKNYNGDDHAPIEIVLYHMVNYIPSPLKNSLHYTIFEPNNDLMTIRQLSGYPDFDFDAFQIFHLMSIENIIKIFFLTVIEQNILFFSANSEILSLTMFLFYALNYPCNDSTYFWHIISVSQCALEDPNNCENNIGKIVQKLMTSLLGVNCTYNDSIKMNESRKCCYIVDIDNKKLIKRISDAIEDRQEKKEFLQTERLIQYIDDIMNSKKNVPSMFLAKIIKTLHKKLNEIYNNEKTDKYDKNDPNIGKFTTFFKTSKKIKEINKEIQMAFYDCYLSILMIFYQDNTLSTSNDKIVKDNDSDSERKLYFLRNINDEKEKKEKKMSEEEQLFCMQFKDSIKYKIYLENFIQDANCLDVYKIPLMFSEEFINIKIQYTKLNCDIKIDYFSLIDKFYLQNKDETLGITLNPIHSEFSDTFGKYCKNLKSQVKAVLNKRLINKYINFVSNYELESSIYPYLDILDSNKTINLINRRLISDIIEEELINIEIINNNGLLFYSSIYIFSMMLFLNDQTKTMNYLDHIRNCFSSLHYFKRKYIYIILMTCYKYMLVHKKTNKYPNMAPSHIKMYFYLLVNYLRQSMIVPNEEMLILFQTFFKQDSELNVEGRDEIVDDEDFIDPSEKNPNIFQIYMPYCFNSKGIIPENQIVKHALKSKCNDIIIINENNITPKILIRLKGIEVISEMYSPIKLYQTSKNFFWKFFEREILDINILNQEELKKIMINLILYGITISQIIENQNSKSFFEIPYLFIINNLYQLLSEKEKAKKMKN